MIDATHLALVFTDSYDFAKFVQKTKKAVNDGTLTHNERERMIQIMAAKSLWILNQHYKEVLMDEPDILRAVMDASEDVCNFTVEDIKPIFGELKMYELKLKGEK